MSVLWIDQIQSQAPIIDTFQTSINFADGVIDSRWNTIVAHQLLASTTSIPPEESDLSGYWKAGYDPENQFFYVLIKIKDDTITSEELIHPDTLYSADHITVYLDLYNDGFSSYTDGYFTFTLFPLTDQYTGRIGPNSFPLGNYDYIESIDKNTTADGWFVEMLFSFKDLLNKQEVLFIDTIGFEAVIADNDDGIGERDYRLSWNDPNVIAWIDPSVMRDIILDRKLNATFKPTCSADLDYEIVSDNGAGLVQVSFGDRSTSNDEIINWSWEFGDNNYSLLQNPVHNYNPFIQNTNSCLYITTKNGCNSKMCKPVYLPPEQYSLNGKVRGTINSSNGWKVIAFQEQGSEYMTFETYSLNNEGFEFASLEEGNYLLYALPEEVDINYFPTYFVNKQHWQQCDNITVNGDVYDVDILLNSYSSDISGPGSISGSLLQETEGIPIVLAGKNGHALKYTLTDATGEFIFNELPYGTFLVYPEFPGMDNSGITIQLSAELPDWNMIQYSDKFLKFDLKPSATHSNYQINYNRNHKELLITSDNKPSKNTKIFIYSILGELLYSCQSGFIGSKTIYTGNFNSDLLFVQIWDGKTPFIKKFLK